TFHLGPAVVAAGFDHIELIPGVLPELARIQGAVRGPRQALGIAVPVAVDQRPGERVVLGRPPVRAHPQNFAGGCITVLRAAAVPGRAGAGMPHPVGTASDPATVVDPGGRDTVQQSRPVSEAETGRLPGEVESFGPVLAAGRVIGVEAVLAHGDTQQAPLTRR